MNKTLQQMNSVIYKTGKNYLNAVSIVATSKCYDHAVRFVSEILADNNKTDVNVIVKCALEDVEKLAKYNVDFGKNPNYQDLKKLLVIFIC
jgi:hypothetical protein